MVGMVWAFISKQKSERSYPLGSCLWISATMNEEHNCFKLEDAKRLFEWLKNK
jgi:6-phosphofructokinase 2